MTLGDGRRVVRMRKARVRPMIRRAIGVYKNGHGVRYQGKH